MSRTSTAKEPTPRAIAGMAAIVAEIAEAAGGVPVEAVVADAAVVTAAVGGMAEEAMAGTVAAVEAGTKANADC